MNCSLCSSGWSRSPLSERSLQCEDRDDLERPGSRYLPALNSTKGSESRIKYSVFLGLAERGIRSPGSNFSSYNGLAKRAVSGPVFGINIIKGRPFYNALKIAGEPYKPQTSTVPLFSTSSVESIEVRCRRSQFWPPRQILYLQVTPF